MVVKRIGPRGVLSLYSMICRKLKKTIRTDKENILSEILPTLIFRDIKRYKLYVELPAGFYFAPHTPYLFICNPDEFVTESCKNLFEIWRNRNLKQYDVCIGLYVFWSLSNEDVSYQEYHNNPLIYNNSDMVVQYLCETIQALSRNYHPWSQSVDKNVLNDYEPIYKYINSECFQWLEGFNVVEEKHIRAGERRYL
uniref:Uncharacterized protein n=1 Tax=Cryptophlebia leucotreta granulosis virus TaxID=35254 RepID=A0A2H4ZKD7_GVCL|nr:hypothetical protein [Cryptophlebia leucotreta granulovirus]